MKINKYIILRSLSNGKYIKSADIKGGIWVVEYFFATCKGICPTMNSQLKRVQKAYINDNSVKIMSFTVDPEKDTIEALKKYAIEQKQQQFSCSAAPR